MPSADLDTLSTRQALEAVRHSRRLANHPLFYSAAVRNHLRSSGLEPTPPNLQWATAELLAQLVRGQWLALRREHGLGAPSRSDEAMQDLLAADFAVGSQELEAWSCLYFRYVVAQPLQVNEIAVFVSPGSAHGRRTVSRRLHLGFQELTDILLRLEAEAWAGPIALPATSVRAATAGGNLPRPTSRFFGRSTEVAELVQALTQTPLVTLTGPPGVGKTRLGLRVAAEVAPSFRDGAWLVDMAQALAGQDVVALTLRTFGLPENDRQKPLATLTHHLATWQALVVLDNCEHLVDDCGAMATAILAQCPMIHIVATSLRPLGLPGERVWRTRPLELPVAGDDLDPSRLLATEAIQLFVDRAADARGFFRLSESNAPQVLEIVRRLDGLPLAIELAAARAGTMSERQIAAGLDDRFRLLVSTSAPKRTHHHHSLEIAIGWSYDLLSPAERELFERLAVFAGAFTLAGAVAVASEAPPGDDVDQTDISPDLRDALSALVGSSLIEHRLAADDTSRYELMESLRAFGLARLINSGRSDLAFHHHARYYLALASLADSDADSPAAQSAQDQLREALPDIEAILRRCAQLGDAATSLQLVSALGRFWQQGGHAHSSRQLVELVLAMPADYAQARNRARVLQVGGALARQQCDYPAATRHLAAADDILAGLGDEAGRANVLRNLGNVADEQGDFPAAEKMYDAALQRYIALGDGWGQAAVRNNQGISAFHQGRYETAAPLLEASLADFLVLGETWAVGVTHYNLGNLAYELGRPDGALAHFHESLSIAHELGDQAGTAMALMGMAYVAGKQGDAVTARARYAEAWPLLLAVDDRQKIAEWLEALAGLDRTEGSLALAVMRLAASDGLRRVIQAPVQPKDAAELDAHLVALRAALGADAFLAAWTRGVRNGWRALGPSAEQG